MAFKKNSPGCNLGSCNCGGCLPIARDQFDRDNSFDINTGAPFTWSGDTSGLEIFLNRLLFSGVTTGSIKCGTANPASSGSGVVYCTFESNDAGEILEVWLNGTDKDNCTVARLTTPDALEIRKRVSGTDSILASRSLTLSGSGVYTLWLKYSVARGLAQASVVDGVDATHLCTEPCAPIDEVGYYAGLAVGPHDFTSIFADDFNYYPLGDVGNGCPEIACPDPDPCVMVTDNFTRPDNTDISAGAPCRGWTEVSGAWSIASNVLQCTTSGIAICNTPHADGLTSMMVTATYTISGNRALIIVGYLDSSNYTYVAFGVSGVSLNRVAGGVDTQLHSDGMSTASGGVAKVCVTAEGKLTAYRNGTAELTYTGLTFAGTQCGLGKKDTGTVTFDDFEFARVYSEESPTCAQCGTANPEVCSDCCPGGPSRHLTFYWPGGLSSLGGCSECNRLTDEQEFDLAPSISSCQWFYVDGLANLVDCGSDGRASGGDCCSIDPASPSLLITARTLIDTTTSPFTCFMRVQINLGTCPCPSFNARELLNVSYQTSPSAGLLGVLCDGAERDLEIHTEASAVTVYRGQQGWTDGYHGGCAGTLPTTPTIRA